MTAQFSWGNLITPSGGGGRDLRSTCGGSSAVSGATKSGAPEARTSSSFRSARTRRTRNALCH